MYPQKRADTSGSFTGKFLPTFKENWIPILCNLFQKKAKGEMLSNSLCDSNITLTTETGRNITKKGNTGEFHLREIYTILKSN